MRIDLTLNGAPVDVEVEVGESFMDVLRRLGCASVKNGCDHGDCGSCAVLVDGRAVNACLLFAPKAGGCEVVTLEGLATEGALHPLQVAALDGAGLQCGFCAPGMLLTALDLFTHDPDAGEAEVRKALTGNFCRCTGYVKQVEALLAGAAAMRDSETRL